MDVFITYLIKLFYAVWIVLGLFMLAKYINMCRYQFWYGKDAGDLYLSGELTREKKEELKRVRRETNKRRN